MTDLRVPNPVATTLQNGPSESTAPAIGQMPETSTPRGISAVRKYLLSRGNSSGSDRLFAGAMLLCALAIFALVALIAVELVTQSQLSWHAFGLPFFYRYNVDPVTHLPLFWDPVNGVFYALPFIYGTLMTSLVALCIAVPLAIGGAEGAELRHPLGIAVIGGLLVSQVLTLYTTPVIYVQLAELSRWLRRPA